MITRNESATLPHLISEKRCRFELNEKMTAVRELATLVQLSWQKGAIQVRGWRRGPPPDKQRGKTRKGPRIPYQGRVFSPDAACCHPQTIAACHCVF